MSAPHAFDPLPFPPPYLDPKGAPPMFERGQSVRVRFFDGPGHLRTPWYLRGRKGRVERVCGHFPNPEELAFRRSGLPLFPLYRVRFALADLWGCVGDDTLDAEIFEHWLEPDDGA